MLKWSLEIVSFVQQAVQKNRDSEFSIINDKEKQHSLQFYLWSTSQLID